MAEEFGMIVGATGAMFLIASIIAWVLGKLIKQPYPVRMYIALPIAALIGSLLYMYGDGGEGALLTGAVTYSIGASICAALVLFLIDKER